MRTAEVDFGGFDAASAQQFATCYPLVIRRIKRISPTVYDVTGVDGRRRRVKLQIAGHGETRYRFWLCTCEAGRKAGCLCIHTLAALQRYYNEAQGMELNRGLAFV